MILEFNRLAEEQPAGGSLPMVGSDSRKWSIRLTCECSSCAKPLLEQFIHCKQRTRRLGRTGEKVSEGDIL